MEEARAVGANKNVTLTTLIVAIHEAHKGRYGIDRIHADLARSGYRVSPKRVRRLARAAGLRCVHPRPYKATTVQDPANACGLVNLVGRDFVPGAKDQLWYGDITYIFTMSGWAYLATVIDGYSRLLKTGSPPAVRVAPTAAGWSPGTRTPGSGTRTAHSRRAHSQQPDSYGQATVRRQPHPATARARDGGDRNPWSARPAPCSTATPPAAATAKRSSAVPAAPRLVRPRTDTYRDTPLRQRVQYPMLLCLSRRFLGPSGK